MLRVKPQTLALWRVERRGPRWLKVGRRVLYRQADINAWLAAQLCELGEAMLFPDAERAAPAVTGNGSQNGAVVGAGEQNNNAISAAPQSYAVERAIEIAQEIWKYNDAEHAHSARRGAGSASRGPS